MIKPDAYFAAPLETQLTQFMDAVHSNSKAIWCLRGGYGSMRLVPQLLKMKTPQKSKHFLGFSDITALHIFLNQNWKWRTFHSRNICQMTRINKSSPDRKLLTKILFGKIKTHSFTHLIPLNDMARTPKKMRTSICGGNLRIIQSSLKTSWELRTKNKTLFLEDVSERGYSVDRMLEQLIQAKIIHKDLHAIVFGDFTEGLEIDGSDYTPWALKRFALKVDYPVFRGLPAGHSAEKNFPVPFNTDCELITGKIGQLHCTYY